MAVNRGRNKKVIIGGAVTGILVLLAVAVSAGFVDRFLKKSPAESAKAAGWWRRRIRLAMHGPPMRHAHRRSSRTLAANRWRAVSPEERLHQEEL